ncbi:MAG: aminotransferase class I/II-fold pyridoxal phosphate-dependent enzyme, partial [Gammaproteobacteria bacterium]
VIIKTTIDDGFKISPEQLRGSISENSRIFVINSPSNPSGVSYTEEELAELAEVLLDHPEIIVVTDDIYEHILWGQDKFVNILNACPKLYNRTVVVNGVSKAYSMTGWRIGYVGGPASIVKGMNKIASQSTSNPTSIAQAAAVAELTGDQSYIHESTGIFKQRHDFVYQSMNELDGVQCLASTGTFYSFPDMNDLIKSMAGINNDIELAEFFLEKAEVAMVPGSAFGAPGCMRISFATSMENLEISMERIKKSLAN